jgi:DNA-directed RNA polymerase specialized sigma24 family protein
VDPEQGWRVFVDQHSATILALIKRAGVADSDHRADIYVKVCERLADQQCARLRRFDPTKGAFAAWLTIVVRHAVVDWVRSRAGRRRLFDAIEKLDAFDRRVFELYYWEQHRVSEIVELLGQAQSAPVAIADVFDALVRIERALSDRHRGQLLALVARSGRTISLESPGDGMALQLVHAGPDPETTLHAKRLDGALNEALSTLAAEDAAIIRLLFVRGWALHEVQRALHLTSLTRDRVRSILDRLRAALTARGIADGTGGPGLTFLEDPTA